VPKKAKAAVEDEGVDKSWMESWADAMTLLMAFFVMLFAFALVDETKFYDFKVGMVTALGVSDAVTERADSLLESGKGIALTVGLSTVPTQEIRNQIAKSEEDLEATGSVTPENIEEVRQLLELKFLEQGAAPFVTVDIDDRGIVIRYDGRVLFPSGSAELGQDSGALLLATNEVLRTVDNAIDIEGHTDDVPAGGRFISNWELSSARASAVVRWIIARDQVPASRLAAVGMADTRPVAPNDTEEGRQLNRRVEVVVSVDGLLQSSVDVLDPIGDNPVGVAETPIDDASNPSDPEVTEAPNETTPVDDKTAAGPNSQENGSGQEEEG
jgi:chemotaxis protein MotB